jgi:hypothetical protein
MSRIVQFIELFDNFSASINSQTFIFISERKLFDKALLLKKFFEFFNIWVGMLDFFESLYIIIVLLESNMIAARYSRNN